MIVLPFYYAAYIHIYPRNASSFDKTIEKASLSLVRCTLSSRVFFRLWRQLFDIALYSPRQRPALCSCSYLHTDMRMQCIAAAKPSVPNISSEVRAVDLSVSAAATFFFLFAFSSRCCFLFDLQLYRALQYSEEKRAYIYIGKGV